MLNNTNIIHLVIDIETLGIVQSLAKKGTCPILEAAFATVEYIDNQWMVTISGENTFSLGNQFEEHADKETIEWHSTKNKENYVEMLRASLESPLNVADGFSNSLEAINDMAKESGKEVHYWAQGKDFDYTILSAYAVQNNFTYPFMRDFNFTKTHCLRDLIAFTGHKTSIKNNRPHRAHDDAVFEASVLAEILNSRGA